MYYTVSHAPVTLLTRESLPPFIPLVTRRLEEGQVQPIDPVEVELFLVNQGSSTARRALRPTLLDENELQKITASERLSPGPFAAYVNFRREADLARQSGNHLAAAVMYGACAEAMLRDLHLVLMWDEGIEPRAAMKEVKDPIPIRTLVRSAFHRKLGGRWQTDVAGPIANWHINVASLRNRVIHMGYEPDGSETHASLDAIYELNGFLRDRLVDRIHRFPHAADFFLGFERIETIGGGPMRRWRAAKSEFGLKDPVAAFLAWRSEVERLIDPDQPAKGDIARSRLVRVQYGNGAVRYWLADRNSGLACLAEQPPRSVFAAIEGSGIRGEFSMAAAPSVSATPANDPPQWVAMREVIPSVPLYRFPHCYLPPAQDQS